MEFDVLQNLATGFGAAFSLQNVAFALLGVFLGTLIGVLPGIGPIPAIAMLLPITFQLEPLSALIMLAGIYYGAQYGGSTTSILVNLPGETGAAGGGSDDDGKVEVDATSVIDRGGVACDGLAVGVGFDVVTGFGVGTAFGPGVTVFAGPAAPDPEPAAVVIASASAPASSRMRAMIAATSPAASAASR